MAMNNRTAAAIALKLFFTAPACIAAVAAIGVMSPAMAETLTKKQSDALAAYNNSKSQFEQVLAQRRAQIDAKQPLPNLPGQALYLARNTMMSAYKDLTDALPAKIGGPNKFGIPPAYFDAANEPLLDEYLKLFNVMQAPPANAQNSPTPFKDVVDLGTAIARARGLDAANADVAGRISLGIFFAETNGNQNIGNARSNKYKGSFQTGVSEGQDGQRKWAALRPSIAAFDPALIARDAREEARVGNLDHRYNHWINVRDALMNAHADVFLQIPAIAAALPDPIDQMKLFELIQIVPSPTKSAIRSGNVPDTGFPTRGSWAICATTPCSPSDRPTGRKHRRPSAKFSMRCGCSTRSSSARSPNSTRSGSHPRAESGRRGPYAMTPDRQSGPSMAHRGSQNVLMAATTPLLMMFRRSGEFIWSSSSRLMIEPASSSTAAIWVFLSTISSS